MDLNLYEGTVESFSSVTRNRVQIELVNIQGIFELFIDQSWVIKKGDKIVLSGHEDETGKHVCYAYNNLTKNVTGWQYPCGIFFYVRYIFISLVVLGLTKKYFPLPILLYIITALALIGLVANIYDDRKLLKAHKMVFV